MLFEIHLLQEGSQLLRVRHGLNLHRHVQTLRLRSQAKHYIQMTLSESISSFLAITQNDKSISQMEVNYPKLDDGRSSSY